MVREDLTNASSLYIMQQISRLRPDGRMYGFDSSTLLRHVQNAVLPKDSDGARLWIYYLLASVLPGPEISPEDTGAKMLECRKWTSHVLVG